MIPENGRFSRFEPRKRGSEPRFRGSKRAGISRVNPLTLEIPDVFESRIRDSKPEKWGFLGPIFKKFWDRP